MNPRPSGVLCVPPEPTSLWCPVCPSWTHVPLVSCVSLLNPCPSGVLCVPPEPTSLWCPVCPSCPLPVRQLDDTLCPWLLTSAPGRFSFKDVTAAVQRWRSSSRAAGTRTPLKASPNFFCSPTHWSLLSLDCLPPLSVAGHDNRPTLDLSVAMKRKLLTRTRK